MTSYKLCSNFLGYTHFCQDKSDEQVAREKNSITKQNFMLQEFFDRFDIIIVEGAF